MTLEEKALIIASQNSGDFIIPVLMQLDAMLEVRNIVVNEL